jgi:hypothetical protein
MLAAFLVYGETGWPSGGRFRPHRSHQNGLSVDFFVPVRDATGRSVPLPTDVTTRFGYDIEFDASAKYGQYSIDFQAIAEHLYQLDVAAKAHGVGMSLVIFDLQYLPRLFATPRGAYLQRNLPFMKGKPWVRHDEHYHVDFAVPCKPNASRPSSLDRLPATGHCRRCVHCSPCQNTDSPPLPGPTGREARRRSRLVDASKLVASAATCCLSPRKLRRFSQQHSFRSIRRKVDVVPAQRRT